MGTIKVSFVGDISLNGKYHEILLKKGANYPFKLVKKKFDEADIVAGNLESPFASDNISPEFSMKTPLKADLKYAGGLKWAGFDILNLSNNHIMDYGESGVFETQKILDDFRIKYFGCGRNINEAKMMRIISVNSINIGFVGYTDIVIDSPVFAKEDKSGIAKFEVDIAKDEIEQNKKLVDILVVNLHWGIEYFHLPMPDQINYARKLVDAGADIIIGHHPHIIQGIEKYKHGIIVYSLGNFVFGDIKWDWLTENGDKRTTFYKFSRKNRQSFIIDVILDKTGVLDYSVHGTYISKSGRIIYPYKRVAQKVENLSTLLKCDDYFEYFQREEKRFKRKLLLKNVFNRFKRIYKIRPKHFNELKTIIYKWAQLK